MYLVGNELSARKNVQLYKAAIADWQKQQKFTLFGTCSFKHNSHLGREDRIKAYKRFWNAVDKQIHTAKAVEKHNWRIERFVFEEEGKSRQFLHSHFFCKADNAKQLKQIINATQNFWNERVDTADTLYIDLNTVGDWREGYGIKEYRLGSDEQLLVECCYLREQR